jgi:hypothetical protein
MKAVTIRFKEGLAAPAAEAARAQGISFNEYVQRAVKEKLAAEQDDVRRRARRNIAKYQSVIDYLSGH